MSDTSLRIYCLEQARAILGTASLADILAHAEEIYELIVGPPEPTKH